MRTGRRVLFVSLVAIVAACGSRTGLIAPAEEGPVDAGPDVVRHPDARVPEEDAEELDALPPIDVSPPVDVASDCPDAASTLIYVISANNNLYSFYPPAGMFTLIGTIACPVVNAGDEPFSMAVDRTGIAYTVFFNPNPTDPLLGGELFRVSTATASCEATTYKPNQNPLFHTFGMGFSNDAVGTGETLYVAGQAANQGSQPDELGSIDTTTFALTDIGPFNPIEQGAELTGTGAGDLFAFYEIDPAGDMAIGQLDKTTANLVGQTPLPGVVRGMGWAFAFWGGDFYTFTAPGGSTVVTRYRPADGTILQVGAADDLIVGAGVSTCAPQAQ
jgi:hypothetical protein